MGMKYTTYFTVDGKLHREVEKEYNSEYYARRSVLNKAQKHYIGSKIIILDCKEYNPFSESKDIMDFIKGFGK